MKHLRSVRAHPSALAGGHDEDRERRGHGVRRVPGAGTRHAPMLMAPPLGGRPASRTPGFGPSNGGANPSPPALPRLSAGECANIRSCDCTAELPPISAAGRCTGSPASLERAKAPSWRGPPERLLDHQLCQVCHGGPRHRRAAPAAACSASAGARSCRLARRGLDDSFAIPPDVRGALVAVCCGWQRLPPAAWAVAARAQIDRAIASHGRDPRRLLESMSAQPRRSVPGSRLANLSRQVAERFGTSILVHLRPACCGRTHAHLSAVAAA